MEGGGKQKKSFNKNMCKQKFTVRRKLKIIGGRKSTTYIMNLFTTIALFIGCAYRAA